MSDGFDQAAEAVAGGGEGCAVGEGVGGGIGDGSGLFPRPAMLGTGTTARLPPGDGALLDGAAAQPVAIVRTAARATSRCVVPVIRVFLSVTEVPVRRDDARRGGPVTDVSESRQQGMERPGTQMDARLR
jgi:hypothetical protein